MRRLWMALISLAAVAAMAWRTLTDEKFRAVTLAILAICAVKVLIAHSRMKLESRPADMDSQDMVSQDRV